MNVQKGQFQGAQDVGLWALSSEPALSPTAEDPGELGLQPTPDTTSPLHPPHQPHLLVTFTHTHRTRHMGQGGMVSPGPHHPLRRGASTIANTPYKRW